MAFKCIVDGKTYESNAHFRYVYGVNPPKDLIEEIEAPMVEGVAGSGSSSEGSRMTHPTHEQSGRRRIRGRGPEWCK
ncbi:hypothetical protein A3A84_03845 [Candidatus Collierbacteria bacterium RIFCSPLOWO2_01_FULL_50_23]|uniref:Uncharacterized protein n=1 Tax=Candidatus Collierbacteria bacterium RIFCSPHIGHO2_01_FULL_50_25 TaxID=1817722 RepID=A0A1F5EVB8_9BACT|nr:MAG: hypothetical protein A2703_03425 [Candidatus Collierbacteria bacterium RIFCSPHIGHO2_01_FULL_50_25]OGD75303.1 MAG: hypothetical protein A3A84_03845 [Candidatus Collierbacteria bacterium RIFCSPLOWO2_01_FULL_50_23]